jgi:hypothetical protein
MLVSRLCLCHWLKINTNNKIIITVFKYIAFSLGDWGQQGFVYEHQADSVTFWKSSPWGQYAFYVESVKSANEIA